MNTAAAPTAVPVLAESGPGACCVEAQADGVPCTEIRDCEVCGRAHPVPLPVTAEPRAVPH